MALTDRQLVAHLLRRAGFGSTAAELDSYAALGFDAAVDRLLNYESVDTTQFDADLQAKNYDLSRLDGCQNWWLYRMLFTPRPLQEKMTLFWHGHFASTNDKVEKPPYMLLQNQLFRDNALGKFDELVLKVTQDPAMLVFLDGKDNRKRLPNENYARELMELFTLGIGNYSEQDIKESARALTGWTVKADRFFVDATQHDIGTKTFLGQKGNFDGTDICRIVCQQPACAPFIARKLIRFFAMDNPSDDFVGRIAGTLRSSGLSVKAAVEAIFRSPEFRSEACYRATIKSPVELMVGVMKGLGVAVLPTDFPNVLRQLQQELFNPPGVQGWDGGQAWLSTTTFLGRSNLMYRLTSGNDPTKKPFISPVDTVTQNKLTTNAQIVDYYVGVLLNGDVSPEGKAALLTWLQPMTTKTQFKRLRGLIHLILTSPAYQLN
jgi:uncharacterized protein (DUF1800 family)